MGIAAEGMGVTSAARPVPRPAFCKLHELDVRIAAAPLKRSGKPEELGAAVAFFRPQNQG